MKLLEPGCPPKGPWFRPPFTARMNYRGPGASGPGKAGCFITDGVIADELGHEEQVGGERSYRASFRGLAEPCAQSANSGTTIRSAKLVIASTLSDWCDVKSISGLQPVMQLGDFQTHLDPQGGI